VRIRVDECSRQPFALKLRIPGWVKDASVRINQGATDSSPVPESYFEIRRVWRPGDVVDLDLPMPVRLMEANPLVEEDANQVAVQRGPVVYCVESVDLPKGVRPADLAIPAGIALAARYDSRLLQGVVVLEGEATVRPAADWRGQLYREARLAATRPVRIRLVPYYAWGNRGGSEMSVWLARGGW
jgi:hypothetical protein